MKLKNESGGWCWEFDKFHFFTESEKCSILESLNRFNEICKGISEMCEEGGIVEMHENLIKELKKSLNMEEEK